MISECNLMDDAKILCELLGGSHLYGLNTPASDEDTRGIVINTSADYILGLRRYDESRKQNAAIKQDIVFKELSAWVRLLYQGNTEAFEILFAPESKFISLSPEIKLFRATPYEFIDSRRLFGCLRGYGASEARLVAGLRTGVLGSKRKQSLDTYGYSPKNATQLLRLFQTGIEFFTHERYVVETRDFGSDFHAYLMEIKTNPSSYSLELFEKDYREMEARLVMAFESYRKKSFHFNEKLANKLLLRCYFPHLQSEYSKISL